MSDPLGIGVGMGLTLFVGQRVGRFLDAVLEPAGKALGEDLKARYEGWRRENLEEVAKQALGIIDEAGVALMKVPGRILFPILEYASLEEDAEMRARWASLLASAASDGKGDRLLPGFADILRQLAPIEVRMLDSLHASWSAERRPGDADSVPKGDIKRRFDLSDQDYLLLVADLDRLQLIEGRRLIGPEGPSFGEVPDLAAGRWDYRIKYERISLTALGVRFVQCCSEPNKLEDAGAEPERTKQ